MDCLIVDDNKIARMAMKQLSGQVPELNVLGDFSGAIDAYNFLKENKVDLLFLDIEMPGMTGLELTKQLGPDGPMIIFTTSRKDYAVEAFELNVADYIVKPVTAARFLQAIEKVREITASKKEEVKLSEDEFIFIRDSNIVRRLRLEEILYAEAMGDYVKLHTSVKFYAVHTTLKSVEERLPASQFSRVHRSYLVNISRIDTIQDGSIVVNGKYIPVADAYRAALNRRLNVL
ncbi:MAG: response regulator transcription factor [Chitinophagaceae bacterium]|nr:MAG: response regulator transcription factor [Chitinophagaceae bacterium]